MQTLKQFNTRLEPHIVDAMFELKAQKSKDKKVKMREMIREALVLYLRMNNVSIDADGAKG